MSLILRGLLVMATAGALSLPSNVSFTLLSGGGHSRTRPVVAPTVSHTPTKADFKSSQIEHYLSDDVLAYVRPGLNIQIVSITNVAPGQHPVVEIKMTDDFGQPLDRNGALTPGKIDVQFILAQWDPDRYEYVNLTTVSFGPGTTYPLHDSGGTWTDLAMGDSTYTFAKQLPADLDTTKTYTLGIYADRGTMDILGKDYNAPATFKVFRPDGGTPTTAFQEIATSNCNQCHDPLSMHGAHGPAIQNVGLCVMCHTSQMPTSATGQSLFFKTMIHKIHDGENLPSVQAGTPYEVTPGEDFSDVAFPQDIRNCSTCHGAPAVDNAEWYTRPTRAACGACHDDVNFATGENHPGGIQTNDDECADCHVPDTGLEYDASIKGAHTVPEQSKQLKGLKAEIVSVTNAVPGMAPTVVFKFTENDGTPVDATKLDRFAPYYAGPTTSYRSVTSGGTGTYDPDTGLTTYTFNTPIPADATGTYAFTTDAYRWINLTRGDGGDDVRVREAVMNPVTYVAVTGDVTPRRMVVDVKNCDVCHKHLSLHGGNRQTTLVCVMCHNPLADDSSQRPADQLPPESISFQRLIHRIHTGENLTQNYTVYGYHGSVNTFNDVVFPGNTMDCAKCHVGSSYVPPLPTGIDSVITQRDYFSPQGPSTASCLGCHDNSDAAAHAWLNTTTFPGWDTPSEACATCHGSGKDWAVDKVHAR